MPDFYWGLGGTQLQTSFSFLKEEKKKKGAAQILPLDLP